MEASDKQCSLKFVEVNQKKLDFYNNLIAEVEHIQAWTVNWKKALTVLLSIFIPIIIFVIDN
ncbi:MAG: hypothetical protein GPJ52_11660 [Candidatus Heimdallarchaeota archaeon]|nr:hypothetical protein [Candidatus Heimdallarchaeota archaeon]